MYKIPAGWLIEKAGWKGYRNNHVGCYEKQALILVNYGKATSQEILQLANNITASVFELFEIHLEKEVKTLSLKVCKSSKTSGNILYT
jgi:UDP-N-acetylmuramate dehydrogenase